MSTPVEILRESFSAVLKQGHVPDNVLYCPTCDAERIRGALDELEHEVETYEEDRADHVKVQAYLRTLLEDTEKATETAKKAAVEYRAVSEQATRMAYNRQEALTEARGRIQKLVGALQKCCDETDYCYVCDGHPSQGHSASCLMLLYKPRKVEA